MKFLDEHTSGVGPLFLTQGKILAALGVLGLLIILGCGLLSVFLFAKAKDVQEASGKRRPQHPDEMPEAAGTSKLLGENHLEERPSVTERTTELLFTEKNSSAKGNLKSSRTTRAGVARA